MLSLLLGVVTHFLVNQDTDDSDAKRQKTAGVRVIFDRNNVLSCRSNKVWNAPVYRLMRSILNI